MGGDVIDERDVAASALAWWLDAGVDWPVAEQPRNWFAPPAPAAPAVQAEPPPAQLPDTLPLFRGWLESAPDLPLAAPAARRVLPIGAEDAEIMILSDPPSADDSAQGRPMTGEAEALMIRMLAAIGLAAEQAYVANLACFHAPGGRMKDADLQACAGIARRHVAVAGPKRLLLFGDAPVRALLGKPLAEARGHVFRIEGVRTVATFHPRFLIDRPSSKSLAWRDLLLLMEDET